MGHARRAPPRPPAHESDGDVRPPQTATRAGRLCRGTMTASRRARWASFWIARASAAGSAVPTAGSTCRCSRCRWCRRLLVRAPVHRAGRGRVAVTVRASVRGAARNTCSAAGVSRCGVRGHGKPAGVCGMRARRAGTPASGGAARAAVVPARAHAGTHACRKTAASARSY